MLREAASMTIVYADIDAGERQRSIDLSCRCDNGLMIEDQSDNIKLSVHVSRPTYSVEDGKLCMTVFDMK